MVPTTGICGSSTISEEKYGGKRMKQLDEKQKAMLSEEVKRAFRRLAGKTVSNA
jgi:hypothetical protein